MFEIPVEDVIFVICALIGGGLLLITVLVDDIHQLADRDGEMTIGESIDQYGGPRPSA